LSGARGKWQNRPDLPSRGAKNRRVHAHIIALCCWSWRRARRGRRRLIGVIGGKAAVVALDGGEPKT
jgi:hypothetical protein